MSKLMRRSLKFCEALPCPSQFEGIVGLSEKCDAPLEILGGALGIVVAQNFAQNEIKSREPGVSQGNIIDLAGMITPDLQGSAVAGFGLAEFSHVVVSPAQNIIGSSA